MNTALKPITVQISGTDTLKVNDPLDTDILYEGVRLIGTVTLTGNYDLNITGTPLINQQVLVVYEALVTPGVNTLYIQGTAVPNNLLTKYFIAECIYNGTTWKVNIEPDFSQTDIVGGKNIANLAVTDAKINDVSGTKITNLSITGAKLANSTITATQIAASTITATELANNAVTNAKILNDAVTLPKIADQANNTLLGNNTGAASSPIALTVAQVLTMLGIPGGVGITSYGHFYALMPGDNAATIAVGAAVLFPNNGAFTDIIRMSSSQFVLPVIGNYEVTFQVSIDEPCQLIVGMDATTGATELPHTVVGRATGTNQVVGMTLITTTVTNSVLTIRNPTGNAAALTITPIAGGTHAVSASVTIKRFG